MITDLIYTKDKSFLSFFKRKFVHVNIKIKLSSNLDIKKFVFTNRDIYKIYHGLEKHRKEKFKKMNIKQMIICCILIYFVGRDKKIKVKDNNAVYLDNVISYKIV